MEGREGGGEGSWIALAGRSLQGCSVSSYILPHLRIDKSVHETAASNITAIICDNSDNDHHSLMKVQTFLSEGVVRRVSCNRWTSPGCDSEPARNGLPNGRGSCAPPSWPVRTPTVAHDCLQLRPSWLKCIASAASRGL